MRRPWWERPSWTRHVETTPSAPVSRPWQERCGVPAAEEVAWQRTTAYLGVELDATFAEVRAEFKQTTPDQPAPFREGPSWLACAFLGVFVIALVIGVLS